MRARDPENSLGLGRQKGFSSMATVADCAAHLFLTERRFYELLGDGTIDRQPANSYDLDLVREQYIENLREVGAGRASSDGNPDLTKERTRLAKEQADAQEMRNAVTRGQLVPIEEVGQAVESEYSTVRANFLSMPGDLADDLVGLQAAEIEEQLASKVAEILHELSADTRYAARQAGRGQGQNSSAAASAEPDPMD